MRFEVNRQLPAHVLRAGWAHGYYWSLELDSAINLSGIYLRVLAERFAAKFNAMLASDNPGNMLIPPIVDGNPRARLGFVHVDTIAWPRCCPQYWVEAWYGHVSHNVAVVHQINRTFMLTTGGKGSYEYVLPAVFASRVVPAATHVCAVLQRFERSTCAD